MSGVTTGGVRLVLRLEGLCILAAALVAYSKFGLGWGTFVLFFLVPDLSFLGYLAGPRIGAASYNLAHSYVGAVACLAAGFVLEAPLLLSAGIIWVAHIGFDRALGYGLKYSEGFGFTHLGQIGRAASSELNQFSQPKPAGASRFPWHLIGVFGAIALAGLSIAEFRSNAKPSSLLIAAGWIGWSFSWYAKPFQVDFRAVASKAVVSLSLRTWVPPALWTFVTFSAMALLLVGVVLKFAILA